MYTVLYATWLQIVFVFNFEGIYFFAICGFIILVCGMITLCQRRPRVLYSYSSYNIGFAFAVITMVGAQSVPQKILLGNITGWDIEQAGIPFFVAVIISIFLFWLLSIIGMIWMYGELHSSSNKISFKSELFLQTNVCNNAESN